jgi:autotransporter-associated beta strand protein
MQNSKFYPSFSLLTAGAFGLLAMITSTPAATLSWSGAGGANVNWNLDANWGFAGIPASGDTLIFPASQPNLANNNNIVGLTLNHIRFVGAGGGYVIGGNAFTLTNGIAATNTAGVNAINNNITLAGADQIINVGSGSSLTLGGALSGSFGVTKIGLGTLTYSGSANSYSGGTIALEGTLELSKPGDSAIPNTLQVGDPTHSATVRWLSGNQIPNTSTVTVYGGSVLDVNNLLDDLGTLNLYAATVNMGTGFLDFRPPHSINALSGTATINGRIGLPSGDIAVNATGSLVVNATITGSFGFSKSGLGTMTLNGTNTYSGLTVVQAGWLRLQNGNALGSSASGTVVSNLASLVLNAAFGVTNESLTLNGFGASTFWGAFDCEASGNNFWTGPVTLNADSTIAPYAGANVLRISGAISGPGGLIVGTETGSGSGSLYFEGTNVNTYAGTTLVNAGTLFLARGGDDGRAIPGPLVISKGVVRLGAPWQIYSPTESVTMSNSTLLDLNNFDEWIGPLDMTGAQITTGTGLLYLGASTLNVNASTVAMSTISGRVDLWSSVKTITCASGSFNPALQISANVSGTGIIKNGTGNLQLSGANTYGGLTTINNGFIIINQPTGLGTGAAGTVLNGGRLSLVGAAVLAEPLTNTSASSILQASGASGWGTNVVLNAEMEIQVLSAGTLDISGTISGSGGITKTQPGTLRLSGGGANTYAGTTVVDAGTLELGKTAFTRSVPGNLVINNSAITRLASSEQTANSADVLVNGGGLFDFATFDTYLDTLHGSGTVNFGIGGWIWIGLNNGSSTFDGLFTGTGYAPGWTVGKSGTGTFTMNGNNTFTAGNINIQGGGKMVINGSQPTTPVILASGSTLGGSGSVGRITANGIIAPGTSPGILSSSNVTFSASGQFSVELTGPTPGTDYDQLNVRGTNILANAALGINLAFTNPVAIGQQFTIIDNDGVDPVTGIFAGYPGGSTWTQNGFTVALSYTGGTGNDVVLTLTTVPSAAAGSSVTAGNGNGVIDPNECNYLSVVITNKTATPMTGVSAVLSSITSGVAVTDPLAGYPNIAGNGLGTNAAPFQISTTPGLICGTDINLLLTVTTTSHGAFTIPVILPSGQPAVVPVRFDNNIVTNVPDIGTIESTNTVASWSGGPVAKIAVSLWLVAPFSGDMTLTLIAPDGTPVLLSSGNGAGANFGTGSADANRTTFDDAGATAITAGASPFVGTFRPQASLATLLASNPVGNWRLRLQDGFGSGSPDTLRAWSLFLYPTDCAVGSGLCELCPNVVITSATGPANPFAAYLNPNGIPSICGVAKACPGIAGGSYPTENYRFRNGPANACITVTLENPSPSFGMVVAAYTDGYNPANPDKCANYLADAGNIGFAGVPLTFSFDVAANAAFVVNVLAGGDGPYKLTVTGGDCQPALNITDVGAGKALLDWTTAAPGYQLESTNSLSATSPVWQPAGSAPVVVNSRFTATNNISGTNQFFRLRKQVP